MHWTEPATADDSHAALEKTLWDAANQLWSHAALKPSEYSPTVLGLIFLRYADVRFAAVKEEIQPQTGSRRKIGPTDFHAAGVVYLPDEARFSHLLSLPEGANVGQAVNEAMRAIEKENPDLADVLPKCYHILESRTLVSIPMDCSVGLRPSHGATFQSATVTDRRYSGDTFGLIYDWSGATKSPPQGSPEGKRGGAYQYFFGKFAISEGQKGGEWSGATWTLPQERPEGERGGAHQFCTPTSIVRLVVEILEPYHGRILDPACGSGGMFIQSARFVEAHQKNRTAEISVRGQDKWAWGAHLRRAQRARRVRQRRKLPNQRVTDTARLARLNLAVHGLSGEIKQGNTYYEDLQNCVEFPSPQPSPTGRGSSSLPSPAGRRAVDEGSTTGAIGRFDFVLANPPFNVSKIDKERLAVSF